MNDKIQILENDALSDIKQCDSLKSLDDIRVKYLGRKGKITELLRALSDVPPQERPAFGKASNILKNKISDALESKKNNLKESEQDHEDTENGVDFTLPGRKPKIGHQHPVSSVCDEIVDIFGDMGFQVATGPDVETEYYNFDSLNTPKDHPARDLHDTFFIKPGVVLRTHTSPVQMRVMETTQPPVAIVAPGRVYRCDADSTHSPMFVQVEGLLVDRGVTFADLKGTLMYFIHRFFGESAEIRFRPHYFPFTEPSAEVDIAWTTRDAEGREQKRWLEVLGCGMVHPEVFRHAGYDYEQYSGFAFGMGVDRLAMIRHSISSISYLYENDLRFLEQF